MKKDRQQKISIKKLTIARISVNSMKKIEGGTSVVTSEMPEDGEIVGYCFDIK